MSEKPQVLPCPSPRVCAHEPIIREMALAAVRLLSWGQEYQYGTEFCATHNRFGGVGGVPCRLCDLEAFQRGYHLVTAQAPWIVLDCVAQQVVERDATIKGLNEQVCNLREEARRAQWAREQALKASPDAVHVKASSAGSQSSDETDGVRKQKAFQERRCRACGQGIVRLREVTATSATSSSKQQQTATYWIPTCDKCDTQWLNAQYAAVLDAAEQQGAQPTGTAQTEAWTRWNRRRGELIDKRIAGAIMDHEVELLEALQAYADEHVEHVAPRAQTEACECRTALEAIKGESIILLCPFTRSQAVGKVLDIVEDALATPCSCTALREELEREEREHLATIAERDLYSEHIGLAHIALGGDGEWSSCQNLEVEIVNMAASLRAELAKAKAYADFEESRIVAICEVIGAEDLETAAEKVKRLLAERAAAKDATVYCNQTHVPTAPAALTEERQVLAAVIRAFAPGGCGCIDDLPGDNETCSAHRTLVDYARKHQRER